MFSKNLKSFKGGNEIYIMLNRLYFSLFTKHVSQLNTMERQTKHSSSIPRSLTHCYRAL